MSWNQRESCIISPGVDGNKNFRIVMPVTTSNLTLWPASHLATQNHDKSVFRPLTECADHQSRLVSNDQYISHSPSEDVTAKPVSIFNHNIQDNCTLCNLKGGWLVTNNPWMKVNTECINQELSIGVHNKIDWWTKKNLDQNKKIKFTTVQSKQTAQFYV